MIIKATENQSLFDVAIQYLGSILAAVDIALANNISVTATITPGMELKIPASTFKNAEVASYFSGRNQNIATNFTLAQNQNSVLDYLYPQTIPLL